MREQKKGQKGIAPNYITRTRAVRYLQVTLKDFRRLCILKGIFPRDPKKKNAGKDKVYYHKKDISFLAHEPLLAKFRELKIFMRRIKRAQSKKETGKLDKLQANRPRITLDHLVKERYPTFVDALRDLDDPLTMLHLFAALPNNTVRQHTDQTTAMCLRLCREFQHYVARTHSLRKVFLSIKGVYYQAEIMGQPITWLVPHQFAQKLPSDVDFRVMFTFLEFYMTMAKFVNFRLFNELGLAYPPTFDMVAAARGAGMFSLHVRTKAEAEAADRVSAATKSLAAQVAARAESKSQAQSSVDAVVQRLTEKEASGPSAEEADAAELQRDMAEFDKLGPQEAKAATLDVSATVVPKLFAGSVFLLGREVPQDHMEFIITSAGGRCVRMEDLDGTAARTDQQLKGTGMGKKRKAATAAPSQLTGTGQSSNPLLKEKALALDSPLITHHVIDRSTVASRVAGREYVQPQWLVDSFNARALLPTEPYAPGAALPPHLSPFVDDVKEGYIPKQREVLEQWGAHYDTPVTSAAKEAAQPAAAEEDEEAQYRKELENEAKGVSYSKAKQQPRAESKQADEEEEEEEAEGDEDEEVEKEDDVDSESDYEDRSDYESEDEAAAKGRRAKVAAAPTLFSAKPAAKKAQPKQAESEDPKELAKLMMGKKAARLYSRMQHGIQAKQAVNDKLAARRELIESGAGAGARKRKSVGAEDTAADEDGGDVEMEADEAESEEEVKPAKKTKGRAAAKAPAEPAPAKKQKAAPAPAATKAKAKAKGNTKAT